MSSDDEPPGAAEFARLQAVAAELDRDREDLVNNPDPSAYREYLVRARAHSMAQAIFLSRSPHPPRRSNEEG
jgi:hypothetical protein